MFTIIYVAFLIDADALVKITKAGLKESLSAHLDLRVAPVVEKEVVREGKELGHADAAEVEHNLAKKRLRVAPEPSGRSLKATLFQGGEADLVALFEAGDYAAVISDDGRFLKRAIECGIDVLTPSATLVLLERKRKLSRKTVCQHLTALRPFISREEFALAYRDLGCGGSQ